MSIADRLIAIAENQQKVYDAGYNKGKSEGGGDNWYDTFWDSYQRNGTRKDYQQAFRGVGWRGTTFKPKYNMTVTSGNYFLYATGIAADPIDLIALEESGLIIDFSKCTSGLEAAFSQSNSIKTVGTVDLSSFKGKLNSTFSTSKNLQKIKLLKVTDKITMYQTVFTNCTSLTEIEFDGVIGASIDFASCPLNKKSIVSIIEHLSTGSGQTLTLKKSAVNTAFGINVDDESTYPEGSEYYNLRHSKDNWTFTYA